MFYAILLMMVAAFLALRLYSVLGKRSGEPLARPAEERVGPKPVARTVDVTPEVRDVQPRPIDSGAEGGIRAIVGAEPGFDVTQFVDGAQAAYRMILEAFWKGDREALRALTTEDVYASFDEAIAARETDGLTLDNRLVSIERAVIADASLAGREARIAVRFDADIAAVTRDAEGNVVAGSTDDAVETHDLWTFARTLKTGDPNWRLADTDDA
ncbi:Tim44/TimA family putative adaptor protein [Sphingomonas sp.]|uniref:Tim44/TimA family putative adaptor protein n=1 Tax=Sphingomonas sp. TaxID=28214 RepID=UPI0035C87A8F